MKCKDCGQNNMIIDGQEIATWHSPHLDATRHKAYHAVNMTAVIAMVGEKNLSIAQKTHLPSMMAGYGRVIDENGFIGWGDCEFESIVDLFEKALARGKVKPVSTEPDLFA